ncbi:N-terminal cleavage protein [Opitutaceae bacterium TAV5]|nr:N-terminal cleavage protein [Opitutaceae bacterium TAV5]
MNYLPSSCYPSPRPAKTGHAGRAFTLIELLTVIAIIGILAAIIIPTVGKVRETARAAQCLSNIRQIAMALNLYADDNKDLFPTTGNSDWVKPSSVANPPGIFDYLRPGTTSTQFWNYYWTASVRFKGTPLCCPAFESRDPVPYSYGLNELLTEQTPGKKIGSSNYASRAKISTPSQAMLVIEANKLNVKVPGSGNGEEPAVTPRHGSQLNLAYVDAHVGKIKYEDIPTSPTNIFWSIYGN